MVKHKPNLRNVHLCAARLHLASGNGPECVADLRAYFAGGQAHAVEDATLHEQIARELRVLAGELPRDDPEHVREARLPPHPQSTRQGDRAGAPSPGLLFEVGAAEELLAGLIVQTRRPEAVRRFKAAISAYTKGIEQDPKHLRLLVKRGWTFVNVGQNDVARKDFGAALDVDPMHAEAHTGLGYALASLKDPDPVAARHHANMALLWGGGDYIVVHNVACIFAVLADNEPPRTKEFQDLAIDQVRRAVALWDKGGRSEPSELRLIAGESAFERSLIKRPEIEKLLKTK